MYEALLAELYDEVYEGRGKDYAAEAMQVMELVRGRRPGADSLLDVACGTGAHLRHFARWCRRVEGLDRSGDMLALARAKLPGVPLHTGDMRSFRLPRRFAAVTCLFSSIGHLASVADLAAALARFAAHLEPGGVVVVEPWWFPETFLPGYVAADVTKRDGRTITRVSHSTRDGSTSRIEVHYLVAGAAGIQHLVDRTALTLFDRAQYEQAFHRAGLAVAYLPGGPSGRGLFVGG